MEAGQCGSPTIEQQLQIARDAIQEAENRPPCKLKNFTGGIVDSDEYDRRCNTEENILLNMTTNIMTNSSRRTVDDGYTYPENATDEEKAAIDAQEFKAWVEAGTPGEKVTAANPNCDLLSTEERSNTICHDRKDASDITGLYTCNDGTHKKDWRVCKDVSGYEYGK